MVESRRELVKQYHQRFKQVLALQTQLIKASPQKRSREVEIIYDQLNEEIKQVTELMQKIENSFKKIDKQKLTDNLMKIVEQERKRFNSLDQLNAQPPPFGQALPRRSNRQSFGNEDETLLINPQHLQQPHFPQQQQLQQQQNQTHTNPSSQNAHLYASDDKNKDQDFFKFAFDGISSITNPNDYIPDYLNSPRREEPGMDVNMDLEDPNTFDQQPDTTVQIEFVDEKQMRLESMKKNCENNFKELIYELIVDVKNKMQNKLDQQTLLLQEVDEYITKHD